MFKIKILDSNEIFEYEKYREFSIGFIYYSSLNIPFNYSIDEENISFDEYKEFLSILLEQPFLNEDNCNNVEELVEWTKSIQFLSLLEDELS